MKTTGSLEKLNLKSGQVIYGKWNKQAYVIQRKLGQGAIGTVYLCKHNNMNVALKISDQSSSITMEVNVLKTLQKVQDTSLGPFLIDVDDFIAHTKQTYSFYVMEYLHGERLDLFIKKNGTEWLTVFLLQLLDDLAKFHHVGYAFGDLKIDNVIIANSPPRIRLIDVGGTTKLGRAIKEYTEFYDRGYWGLGTRKAEPSYDLFALVMTFIAIFHPKTFSKDDQNKQKILQKLNHIYALRQYEPIFKKAILGKYSSALDMKKDILEQLSRVSRHKQKKNKTWMPFIIESTGIFIVSICYYVASLLLH